MADEVSLAVFGLENVYFGRYTKNQRQSSDLNPAVPFTRAFQHILPLQWLKGKLLLPLLLFWVDLTKDMHIAKKGDVLPV